MSAPGLMGYAAACISPTRLSEGGRRSVNARRKGHGAPPHAAEENNSPLSRRAAPTLRGNGGENILSREEEEDFAGDNGRSEAMAAIDLYHSP